MARRSHTYVVFGLSVALAGPPLIAFAVARFMDGFSPVAKNGIGQAALWLLAALVLVLVLRWEREPLSSIGIRQPTWRTLASGVAGAAVLLHLATPLSLWIVEGLGLHGFGDGVEILRQLPTLSLALAAVTAGVVEEILYRGYAIERLATLVRSRSAAAAVALAAFSLAHYAFWGFASVVLTAVAGAFLTALYLWRRDLCANMLAHGLTVLVQLSQLAPAEVGR